MHTILYDPAVGSDSYSEDIYALYPDGETTWNGEGFDMGSIKRFIPNGAQIDIELPDEFPDDSED